GPRNYLDRLLQPFPHKTGSQNGVSIYDFLPGAFQKLRLQVSFEIELQLFDINSTSLAVDRVEEHALLHGRERVDVFNVCFGIRGQLQHCHFPLPPPSCPNTLLSSLSSSPAKAKSDGVNSPAPAARQCSMRARSRSAYSPAKVSMVERRWI